MNNDLKTWMQASRPFSFPASIVPVLVGAMFTLAYHEGPVMWWLFPIVLVASVLFHAATNLVSEYFDYKKGVDREETFGSSRVLVEKMMKPKSVLYGGIAAFALGFLLGLVLVYFRGTDMLLLGLIGLAGGFFYTGWPIGYKYFALGDLLVFVLMGPLMVIGSYLALTGTFDMNVFLISLPVGFLVAAILSANNLRDIIHDSEAKIKTVAMFLGFKGAKIEYYLLVAGAFISVLIMVIFGVLAPWALLPFLSLPVAIRNMKEIARAEENKPGEIAMVDIKTAQHHLMFGVLLSIGLLLTAIF